MSDEIIVTGNEINYWDWGENSVIKIQRTQELMRITSMPVQLPDGTWRVGIERAPFKTTPT